jgi:hypothetical protein
VTLHQQTLHTIDASFTSLHFFFLFYLRWRKWWLTLKHAKKIKTREYARVVKSLRHTKSQKKLCPRPTKCMVCVVCCETFVKIFLFFLFLGEVAEGRVESNFTYTFQNEVVLPLIFPLCKTPGE